MSGINNVFYSLLLLFTSSFFVPYVNANEWRRQGSPCHRRRRRRVLPFPFLHNLRLRCCCHLCHCACNNLGRLLRYSPLIYPPRFSNTSVHTSPAVPTVVPLPPLSDDVAVDMTTAAIGDIADPDALNLADPAVVPSFRRVGRSLPSSSSYSFSSSLSSSSS